MKRQAMALVPFLLAVTGCATTAPGDGEFNPDFSYQPNPRFDAIQAAGSGMEQDRLAILAMQGDYKVGFRFQETVALQAGYELKDDKATGGFEVVLVVEDSPRHIVLQHLLVMPGGAVIKHWRQDWTYEADQRFEFVADQTWQVAAIPPELRPGRWTQCVYEVSDAPRYCGTGEWNHRYGVSTWTSDRSWRPLPRREYTTRDDYNAINAENRHTITPHGWTHEQDNTKTVRDGRETVATLVREFGFNDYRAIGGYDFEPAHEYWRKTADYWALVRDAWRERLADGHTVVIDTEVDGMPLITATFDQAGKADETSRDEERAAIEALLFEYTTSRSSLVSSAR